MTAPMLGPRSPDTLEVDLGQEVTIFLPRTATAVVLNHTASDVWRLANGTLSEEDIVALLAKSYDAPVPTIREGVRAAVSEFSRWGLLAAPNEA